MSDPFQDVDSAGIEFAETTAKTMEIRQSEPVMEKIVKDYLDELEFTHRKTDYRDWLRSRGDKPSDLKLRLRIKSDRLRSCKKLYRYSSQPCRAPSQPFRSRFLTGDAYHLMTVQ